jgi:hypothetical protein
MADFFKGLTGGFQSGLQLGQAVRQRQMEDALAQEAGKYNVTEGAYGPGLQENIQQLEGLKAQDPAQAAAYDRAIGELTRRQGLAAPDYSVASGAKNYGARQEARQAAAPMRAEGLAGVYRQYGDVAKADELEARAYEQQRALAKEARDVEAFGLNKTKTQLDIDEATRKDAAAKNLDTFNKAFGVANAAAQAEGRVLTPGDIAKLAKDSKLSYSQENELIASQVNRTKAEVDQFRLDVEKLTQGKSHDQLLDLHKNDKRFGDGVHFVSEVDKKTGKHILARVNEATGQVEERLPFKSKAEATAYLMEEARNPANAAIWLQNYQKGAAGISAQEASARKDNALAGLYAQGGAGAGKGTLKQKVADFKEVYGRDPTEAEKGVLAGLVAKDPNKPEKEFDPSKYTATIKNLVETGLSPTAARIEADQLFGRGPSTANEDATLAKANAAKGGAPATATTPAVGLTPQQREQAKPAPQPARAPTTLDAIQSANLEAVSPLAAQFNQSRAQLIQASQSKDPNAIAYYMNQQNALRKQLESEVSRRFGNNAQAVMQQLAGSM